MTGSDFAAAAPCLSTCLSYGFPATGRNGALKRLAWPGCSYTELDDVMSYLTAMLRRNRYTNYTHIYRSTE